MSPELEVNSFADIDEVVGPKVKVSPSVVSVVLDVRPVGTVTESVPMIIRPEDDVEPSLPGEVVGPKVKVSPSVVSVVLDLRPLGIVMVCEPSVMTPELEVKPSVDLVDGVGPKVKVSPSVVTIVLAVRLVGTVIVSDSTMIRPEDEVNPLLVREAFDAVAVVSDLAEVVG